MNNATVIAIMDVSVIVIPVLKADFRFSSVFPCLFNNLVVSIMSLSTEYPISIKIAVIPALDIFIPKRLIVAKVIIISAKAEITTAKLGILDLKIMKTIIDIKTKDNIIA